MEKIHFTISFRTVFSKGFDTPVETKLTGPFNWKKHMSCHVYYARAKESEAHNDMEGLRHGGAVASRNGIALTCLPSSLPKGITTVLNLALRLTIGFTSSEELITKPTLPSDWDLIIPKEKSRIRTKRVKVCTAYKPPIFTLIPKLQSTIRSMISFIVAGPKLVFVQRS